MLLFVGLFLLALTLLFGSLWALHTYLLCTAQTTYEVLKGEHRTPVLSVASRRRRMLSAVFLQMLPVTALAAQSSNDVM